MNKNTTMTIQEGNKLISELDGWECDENQPHTDYLKIPLSKEGGKPEHGKIYWGTFYKEGHEPTSILSFEYHISWDLLMPVVEKIKSLGFDVVISGIRTSVNGMRGLINSCSISDWNGEEICISQGAAYMIDDTWCAVAQFAQWYNTQKTQS